MTGVSTPHSGYHYNGANRRFFEGWYFKVSHTEFVSLSYATVQCNFAYTACPFAQQVTLPGEGQSFAWMYSIEDPAGDSKFCGCGAQVCSMICSNSLTYIP